MAVGEGILGINTRRDEGCWGEILRDNEKVAVPISAERFCSEQIVVSELETEDISIAAML